MFMIRPTTVPKYSSYRLNYAWFIAFNKIRQNIYKIQNIYLQYNIILQIFFM